MDKATHESHHYRTHWLWKSFLAGCYADRACRMGLSVRTFKTHDLARELLRARLEATHRQLFVQLKKVDVLVLDEWLRDPLPSPETREILDILDARYGSKSHILATQLPVEAWHQRFDDPTLADALLDRLVHSAHRLALAGDSMRKRSAPSSSSLRSVTVHDPTTSGAMDMWTSPSDRRSRAIDRCVGNWPDLLDKQRPIYERMKFVVGTS